MSGSTIGGLAGAAIGYYIGGPRGAQLGWMIGSAVGGYVDPDVIQGQRLNDAQIQTSNEGVPRSIIYGTAVVAGNVIQTGPLIETRHEERTGKGGPVQESFTYARTYAIRVCEASPLGTCQISRIWRDDKLVYDVRQPVDFPDETAAINALRADTATFASRLSIYTGSESQLPSPTLEALPAANGGGVGNVPAYRGSCYVVFANDDLTERQGTIPQYRFEVVSIGASAAGSVLPTFGVQTATYTLPSDATTLYEEYRPNYMLPTDDGLFVAYANPATAINAGDTAYNQKELNNNLVEVIGLNILNDGGGAGTNFALVGAEPEDHWSISNSAGYCELFRDGAFCRNLTISGYNAFWWYNEGGENADPNFGGAVWFTETAVYIGVRQCGSPAVTHNRLYKWALDTAPGSFNYLSRSAVITAGTKFFTHMDRSNQVWTLAKDEARLIHWDSGLLAAETYDPVPMSVASVDAFGVDGVYLFLFERAAATLRVYTIGTWTLLQTINLSGSFDPWNCQVVFNSDSIFVRAGRYIKRVAYAASCVSFLPAGWYQVPDYPDYVVNTAGDMLPICGTERSTVTGTAVILADIVADLCDRVGVETASQLDVTQLVDTVRGFVVGRQLPAADAVRSLQQGYFFDFPEWDLKLRGIKRGGAALFAITDDHLVESNDDQDTRAQVVEFPRKINLISADPSVGYEPTKQTAERRTDNIKAVGEETIELPLALTRTESAQKVDVMLKIAWEEALGHWERELPEEFSQMTPSDPFTHGGKRWRAERTETLDGSIKVEARRDRVSAYVSSVTGSTGLTPTTPVSNLRGPTLFVAMNLPSLRSVDNQSGVYVAARGVLPGWIGCVLQLSIDGGLTYSNVLTMSASAVIGKLTAAIIAAGTPLSVRLLGGGVLESVTATQITARANAFALIGEDEVAEVGQFQTATEVAAAQYDLTVLSRGQLGTIAVDYYAGADFVLLDGNVYFLPISASLAGTALLFRPVSIGTAEANAPTYSLVFDPPTFVLDGGGAGGLGLNNLTAETGEILTTETGSYLQVE